MVFLDDLVKKTLKITTLTSAILLMNTHVFAKTTYAPNKDEPVQQETNMMLTGCNYNNDSENANSEIYSFFLNNFDNESVKDTLNNYNNHNNNNNRNENIPDAPIKKIEDDLDIRLPHRKPHPWEDIKTVYPRRVIEHLHYADNKSSEKILRIYS